MAKHVPFLCPMKLPRSKQWPLIMIEGDCLQVINILSEGSSSMASFDAIVYFVIRLGRFFPSP